MFRFLTILMKAKIKQILLTQAEVQLLAQPFPNISIPGDQGFHCLALLSVSLGENSSFLFLAVALTSNWYNFAFSDMSVQRHVWGCCTRNSVLLSLWCSSSQSSHSRMRSPVWVDSLRSPRKAWGGGVPKRSALECAPPPGKLDWPVG